MRAKKPNPAMEAFRVGWGLVEQNPVLGPLIKGATPHFDDSYPMAKEGWAWVDANGSLYANSHRRAEPQEWAYVISHCLLHLALGHVREDRDGDALRTAVDYAGGVATRPGDYQKMGPVQRAQEWFLSSYPLLGGVVSGFKLVTDQLAVHRMAIPVAAISCQMQEIYVSTLNDAGILGKKAERHPEFMRMIDGTHM